jgi:hypothetical protein
MAANPFKYQKEHIKKLLLFQPTLKLDKSLRIANLSYSVALRVLKQVGFSLDYNTYYNIRSRAVSAKQNEFASLIIAFKEAGFLFKCYIEKEIDSSTNAVIKRQLQQV